MAEASTIRVRHVVRRDAHQFVEIDGRLFNRDQIVAVSNAKVQGKSIITTAERDFDVYVPFSQLARLLTFADEED